MFTPEDISVGIYEKALPPDMTWTERLTAAAQAGYDFMEISIDESDERLSRLTWGTSATAELRSTIQETGVAITSICLSGHRRYPMGSLSTEIRKQSLDIMKGAIDFAQQLGVRLILVPGYDVFYEPSSAETQKRFLESLWRSVAWASRAGVMLALENVEKYVTSITQSARFIKELNSPWLQLYADVGNLVAMGYDAPSELDAGAGHLAGVHLKDALKGQLRDVKLGRGAVPFTQVFRKLSDMNFCGPMLLELSLEPDPLIAISEAREWIRTRMNEGWQKSSHRVDKALTNKDVQL